jgi:hypothetical protein
MTQPIWNKFCQRFEVKETCLPLFATDGATVKVQTVGPVFLLKDGSLVFARNPYRMLPKDAFRNNASEADSEDLPFWNNEHNSELITHKV